MADVTVYTSAYCPFCFAAKRLLESLEISFEEIDLDEHPELRQRITEETGWRTVPMIFVGDRLVGGFSDARELHSRGRLLPMIEEQAQAG